MNYLDTLNSMQREAATYVDGPLLILAGAGSGKTRVLVHRIAYMIDEYNIDPWNILAITFTNKAAGEMRERVDRMIDGSAGVWVGTFHATCVRFLRRYINLIGYADNFTIYDTDDQKTVMKDVLKRLEIDPKVLKEKTVLNAISSAKDELIDAEEFSLNAKGDYRTEQIAKAYAEYQDTLKRSNALDFDDIIVLTIKLFREHPEVLENYQNRFRYIMVDEYQDTNTAQFEFIRLLASKYRNLCVVGDDDQSIYKFRGANIGNILGFEKNYPDAKVVKLEQNYRSTQNILDAANSVIRNNAARKEKALWTDKGKGSLIHLRQFENAYEEAEFIAGDIRSACKNAEAEYGECAVLYRTNAQSRILEEAFVRDGITYDIVGGVNFYSRKEIKDMLAYLKTIDNGVDDVAVKRIINVPKRGIGQTTINKVSDYAAARNISFYDALCQADNMGLGKTAQKLNAFVDFIAVFRAKLQASGIKELLEDIIEKTGYVEELRLSDEEDASDRIENIYELVAKAASYTETHDDVTLSSFLEEVALVADIDRIDDEADRVLLMTLHAAKGLEFDRVYIAGCEDGLFPSMMSIFDEDPTAVEEERRLAYVGITRAKKELYLTYAKMRMLRGETTYPAISRFVREIPNEYMDNRPAKERRYDIDSDTFGDVMTSIRKPVVSVREIQEQKKEQIRQMKMPMGNPSASLGYEVGDRVSHMKFGAGTVLSIEQAPRDKKVTVSFDECGQKIMYATFAKLSKL